MDCGPFVRKAKPVRNKGMDQTKTGFHCLRYPFIQISRLIVIKETKVLSTSAELPLSISPAILRVASAARRRPSLGNQCPVRKYIETLNINIANTEGKRDVHSLI